MSFMKLSLVNGGFGRNTRRVGAAVAAAVEKLEGRQLLTAVGLVPTADAYVRDGTFANTNFGLAPDLGVKAAPAGNGYVRNSYLKFDLTGQAHINSAMLQLYGNLLGGSDPSITISAHAVTNNSWTEPGIKFSNAPAITSAKLVSADVAGTNAVFYYLDLTTYFQQQQAASHTTVSIALTGDSSTTSEADFSSNNAANPDNVPLLILDTGTPTPTPTPTPTVTSFGAFQDAYVQGGASANSNFGSSPQLEVKQSNSLFPDFTRVSYLTFDLSSVSSGATINSATLSLYGKIVGSNSLQVDVHQVPGGAFNQNTITYNNAPAIGTFISSAVVQGSTSTTYSFDLKSYVQQDVAAGQSQVTIALVGDTETQQLASFNSAEAGSHQPSLSVSYQ